MVYSTLFHFGSSSPNTIMMLDTATNMPEVIKIMKYGNEKRYLRWNTTTHHLLSTVSSRLLMSYTMLITVSFSGKAIIGE